MKVDKSKWHYSPFTQCVKTIKVKGAIQKKDYKVQGKFPIVSQEKEFISGFCDSKDNLNSDLGELIIFGDHTRVLKFVDFDFCVGADGVKVLRPFGNLDTKFLYYFLLWANIPSSGYSRHFKFLKELNIPHPPIDDQYNIAAELDALQEVIDGYREQIADLDTLAQSIFLDTFGDPFSNSEGWGYVKFSDLFLLKSGESLSAKQFEKGDFPVYGGNGIAGYHNKYNRCGEYVIIGRVGAKCGNVRHLNGKFWLTDNAFELIQKKNEYVNVFLSKLLSLLNLGSKAKKMAQPVISNVSLKNINVILPPLELQQQFSSQVEAIERQKDLLRQQLTDAEMLMAERMQYYFS